MRYRSDGHTHVSEAKIIFDPEDLLGSIAPEPKEVEQPGM